MPKRKARLTTKASASATTVALQIPFMPNNCGIIKIDPTWNTNVRNKEINAETGPLFKAVKNHEAKIFIPAIKNPKQ